MITDVDADGTGTAKTGTARRERANTFQSGRTAGA